MTDQHDAAVSETGAQEEMLCLAIAKRTCVVALYNGTVMTLAPHILYTRHDEPHLRAVTIDQDGRKPKIAKLGTFKLAGLRDLQATKRLFVPQRSFDAGAPEYAGTTICCIQAKAGAA